MGVKSGLKVFLNKLLMSSKKEVLQFSSVTLLCFHSLFPPWLLNTRDGLNCEFFFFIYGRLNIYLFY